MALPQQMRSLFKNLSNAEAVYVSVGVDSLINSKIIDAQHGVNCVCVEPKISVVLFKLPKQFQTKEFDPGSD